MSGGYFDYKEFHIERIIEKLESVLSSEKAGQFRYDTVHEFETALYSLKTSYKYVNRIDYLLSGDDSEETFHKRLAEDFKDV